MRPLLRYLSIGTAVVAACTASPDPVPTGFRIDIAPLTLDHATDACYTLEVHNDGLAALGTADTVVKLEHVCGSQYGFETAVTYVAPCDAQGGNGSPDFKPNTVELTLEHLCTGGPCDDPIAPTNAIATSEFVNPCPDSAPCRREVVCRENADVSVVFDLTVMRDADQGFFDIAVDFSDLFCSAKFDCRDEDSALMNLLHDCDGERADFTGVLAVACSRGADVSANATYIYMNPIVISCDDGFALSLDPRGPEGNRLDACVGPWGASDLSVFQHAVYSGAEALTCDHDDDPQTPAVSCNKVYLNNAIGFTASELALHPGCRIRTTITAADGPLPGGNTDPDATYPVLVLDAPLTSDTGAIACGRHPIGSTGFEYSYTNTPISEGAFQSFGRVTRRADAANPWAVEVTPDTTVASVVSMSAVEVGEALSLPIAPVGQRKNIGADWVPHTILDIAAVPTSGARLSYRSPPAWEAAVIAHGAETAAQLYVCPGAVPDDAGTLAASCDKLGPMQLGTYLWVEPGANAVELFLAADGKRLTRQALEDLNDDVFGPVTEGAAAVTEVGAWVDCAAGVVLCKDPSGGAATCCVPGAVTQSALTIASIGIAILDPANPDVCGSGPGPSMLCTGGEHCCDESTCSTGGDCPDGCLGVPTTCPIVCPAGTCAFCPGACGTCVCAPVTDQDADGIPDLDDLCPLEAEDADGDQDADGCPEVRIFAHAPIPYAGQGAAWIGDADEACQTAAVDAGLPGVYIAWLATPTAMASRLDPTAGYVLEAQSPAACAADPGCDPVFGVAASWGDFLANGGPSDEIGLIAGTYGAASIVTGLDDHGVSTGTDCNGWTSTSPLDSFHYGSRGCPGALCGPSGNGWSHLQTVGAGVANCSTLQTASRFGFYCLESNVSGLDPDGDGILGATDLCPTEPEDIDTDLDTDGCPEVRIFRSINGVPYTADGDAFVATADAQCQADAATAGLPGTYIAWLSSSVPITSRLDLGAGYVIEGQDATACASDPGCDPVFGVAATYGALLNQGGPSDEIGEVPQGGGASVILTGLDDFGNTSFNCNGWTSTTSSHGYAQGFSGCPGPIVPGGYCGPGSEGWSETQLWASGASCSGIGSTPMIVYCLEGTPLGSDPDNDGVSGTDDLCPNEPEDFDTDQDGDGCPEKRVFRGDQIIPYSGQGDAFVAEADTACQDDAALHGLSGTYIAWLAASMEMLDRLDLGAGYVIEGQSSALCAVDPGCVPTFGVSATYGDLLANGGPLDEISPFTGSAASASMLTGLDDSGQRLDDCLGWTSTSSSEFATIGDGQCPGGPQCGPNGEGWSALQVNGQVRCDILTLGAGQFYCFEL